MHLGGGRRLDVGIKPSTLGTDLGVDFYPRLGLETLLLEREFNAAAGFGVDDNGVPQFMNDEPLPPTDKTSRMFAADVTGPMDKLLDDEAAENGLEPSGVKAGPQPKRAAS